MSAPRLYSTMRSRRGLRLPVAAVAVLLALASAGCSKRDTTEGARPDEARHETISDPHSVILITATVKPWPVSPDRDTFLTLDFEAPSRYAVTLPELAGKLEGFESFGAIAAPPSVRNAITRHSVQHRLRPRLAPEYRLAPLVVTYSDKSASPPRADWTTTRPLFFETASVGTPADRIQVEATPVAIPPTLRAVLGWIAWALAALASLLALTWLFARLRRTVKERQMSPRERALRELTRLLARDLVERGRVKEFYIELTMIVRRYIERQHAIRAPELTTEEFVERASRSPDFSKPVLESLQAFLSAADRVKFAKFRPDRRVADDAAVTARRYIETDDEASAAGEGAA